MLKSSYIKDKLAKKEPVATNNSKGLLKYNKYKAENNDFNLKTNKAAFTSFKLS
jgi:hypothetical protein